MLVKGQMKHIFSYDKNYKFYTLFY